MPSAKWIANNREKLRTYSAAFYANNRERINATARAYRATHPEEMRAKGIIARKASAEKRRIYNDAYFTAHPEKVALYQAKYRATHAKQLLAKNATRRARKAAAPINDFTAAQWIEMQEHYGHRCSYCGKRAKGHLTQDHITPLILGGSHTMSNIVPSCSSCNSRKGSGKVLVPVQPLLL